MQWYYYQRQHAGADIEGMRHVKGLIDLSLISSLILGASLLVSSCAVTTLLPDSDPVRIIFHNELPGLSKTSLSDCDYLGTVISSEGHWYDFLYISNAELARGSLNDMHNKASQMGANIVYIDNNVDFKTSVTFLGQAYRCDVITND
jgi:hypothetical protein